VTLYFWLLDKLLKPFRGDPPTTTPLVPPVQDGRLLPAPERVLRASFAGVLGMCWSSGMGSLPTTLPRSLCRISRTSIPMFSSRTSYLKRRGEMLWRASLISAGLGPVARPHRRQGAQTPVDQAIYSYFCNFHNYRIWDWFACKFEGINTPWIFGN
jgi:hypothetical protein